MVNKNQLLRRLLVLGCVLLLCFGLAGGQLVQLQLVDGESYLRRSAEFLTTTSTVSAARGEILDRYGRPLVTNQTGFSLVPIMMPLGNRPPRPEVSTVSPMTTLASSVR